MILPNVYTYVNLLIRYDYEVVKMLIKCIECGHDVSDKASACPNCGCPVLIEPIENTQKIEEETIDVNPNIRNINGKDIDITEIIYFIRNNEKIKAIKLIRDMSGLDLKESMDMANNIERNGTYIQSSNSNTSTETRCPKCGSTQVQAFNKGFGLGKAVGGGILLGGVGLLGGFIGSKKVMVGCLNCGHKWQAGK